MNTNAGNAATLEAISIIERIIQDEDDATAALLLTESEDPARLARAACSLGGALLLTIKPNHAAWLLGQYRQHALREIAAGRE